FPSAPAAGEKKPRWPLAATQPRNVPAATASQTPLVLNMMSSRKTKPFGASPPVAPEPDFNATNPREFARPPSFPRLWRLPTVPQQTRPCHNRPINRPKDQEKQLYLPPRRRNKVAVHRTSRPHRHRQLRRVLRPAVLRAEHLEAGKEPFVHARVDHRGDCQPVVGHPAVQPRAHHLRHVELVLERRIDRLRPPPVL